MRNRPLDWVSWGIWLAIFLLAAVVAFGISLKHPTSIAVWVPAHNLPIYHLISASDMMTTTVSLPAASNGSLLSSQALIGQYTRKPVAKGQHFQDDEITFSPDPALTAGTAPVSILVDASSALNGQLFPGMIVTVWINEPNTGKADIFLLQALVIDVQPVEKTGGTDSKSESVEILYMVVLASPINKQADLLAGDHTIKLTVAP